MLQHLAVLFLLVAFATAARADIFQWEYINPADPSQGKQQSTTLAPDGAGVDAVPGANLFNRNLTMAYLIGADLTGCLRAIRQFDQCRSESGEPHQCKLRSGHSDGRDLRHANLSNASFQVGRGRVCGFNGSCFLRVRLRNTHQLRPDRVPMRRGSRFHRLATAATANLIRPDGHIDGLYLDARRAARCPRLRWESTRSSPIITVDQHLAMGPGGTLRMVFEADAWDSTISFAPGIPVTLGGTLELTFADDVNLASQVGRTFDLFDWTGVNPTGDVRRLQSVHLGSIEPLHHRRSHPHRRARTEWLVSVELRAGGDIRNSTPC